MEYINAKDVLPEELIYEIQQYIGGSMIYIPQSNDAIKSCDRRSNGRSKLVERNKEIRNKKSNGAKIDELMKEYYLSYDTIKSIVYRKK